MAKLKAAIYARVSTGEQTVENQLRELRAVAKRQGWVIVEEFTDNGLSGAKGRDKRPAFDALCKGVARRAFDLVAAWALDRIGRSLIGLVEFLDDLNAAGVDLFLYREGADTRTPAGRMYYQMAGVFAEYERGRLRERVQSGLARAKANGTRLGRPRVSAETEAAVLAARAEGKGKCKIARELGIGVSTVQRIVG